MTLSGFPALFKDDLAACDTVERRWPPHRRSSPCYPCTLVPYPLSSQLFSELASLAFCVCCPGSWSKNTLDWDYVDHCLPACAHLLHAKLCALMSGTSTKLKCSQGTGVTKHSGQHQLDICKMVSCIASLFLWVFFKWHLVTLNIVIMKLFVEMLKKC